MTRSPVTAPAMPGTARRLGLSSSALVVALSLAVICPMNTATFTGVVSFVALCCIPVQMVMAGYLQERPGVLARWSRPARGVALLALTLVLGGAIAALVQFVIADGWGTDFPGLSMFCIVAVVMTLWLTQVCQGWPFGGIGHPLLRAAAMLVAVYVLAYLTYRLLFDFTGFGLPSAPALRPAPAGLFEVWHVLTFLVTAISGLFVAPAFRFAGLPTHPAARAAANTVLCLLWGTALYGVGVGLLGVDVVDFLVWVPVPTLFGGLIVIKMCAGAFYPKRPASLPVNGVVTLTTAIAVGVALVGVFAALATLAHPEMPWGAPTFAGQVWVASATLAFTFPLLNIAADFFGHWPFRATHAPAS